MRSEYREESLSKLERCG